MWHRLFCDNKVMHAYLTQANSAENGNGKAEMFLAQNPLLTFLPNFFFSVFQKKVFLLFPAYVRCDSNLNLFLYVLRLKSC